jgi:predicted permease
MRILRTILWRLAGLFGSKRSDSDLAAELESNVAMHMEENQRRGMAADEARRHALISLGRIEQAREAYREQEGLPFLETFFQDASYGLRMLRKNPGFTAVAVITLALGIGAISAIFSIVNTVLVQPLPYQDPVRLMTIFNSSSANRHFGASPPDFRALRDQNRTFASFSAFFGAAFNLTGTEQPERLAAAVVSTEYFDTLGVHPVLGRAFLPSEENWGSHRVMVVSDGFWRTHLNGEPNFSGRTFNLDGEPYQVIGVMPASFYARPASLQVWVPMAWKPNDNYNSHNNYFMGMVGRLKPGVTQAQAYADLNAIMFTIAERFPENKGMGVDLLPLQEAFVGSTRPALLILLAATALVLLIACVNLANLLLSRSAQRQREIGIRSALGAGRGRLLRQFLTESVLLAILGGACGLGLAYVSLGLLPLASDLLPRVTQVRIDGWVLLFTAGVSIGTGVLFGLLPAIQNSGTQRLGESLKEGGRMARASESSRRLRSGLVIGEVALALVLLIASGLALRSLQRLLRVDPGFSPEHVLTFEFSLPDSYNPQPDPTRVGPPPRLAAFYRDAVDHFQQLPGVTAAAMTSALPLVGENWGKFFTPLDRRLPASIDEVPHVQYRSIYGPYFKALGIRLVRGRLIDEHDQPGAPPVLMINETLARKYWPIADPIGKSVLLEPPENLIPAGVLPPGYHVHPFQVVGVVGDAHYGGLDEAPEPAVYASALQHDFPMNAYFAVRANGDPAALISSVRNALAQIDKDLPMAKVATMEEIESESVVRPKLEAILLGLFGGLAMLLAGVGIYGVMSYSVNQRTGEIGIRMALGADRTNVLALICKQGLMLAGIGLAAGLVLAFAGTRLLSKILFGVSPTDPLTFASIAVLLAAVALLACYIPARRATRVDPMVALRYE